MLNLDMACVQLHSGLDMLHTAYDTEGVVLCQDLVQVKMRNFSPF